VSQTETAKTQVIQQHRRHETDTGSAEVQIALLTERINHITGHLKDFSSDNHSRYGLLKLVGQRKSLLEYLTVKDITKYRELIKKLNIRK